MSTLVHETWGNHEALIARVQTNKSGNVGTIKPQTAELASQKDPFNFEYGKSLDSITINYETYGELNTAKDNAILICHALTGSAHAAGTYTEDNVPGWWDPLIGPEKPIDTNRYFVISSNVLGGCYGTTGPSSLNPKSNKAYQLDFPRYTIRDMVKLQKRLIDYLGIESLASVIGGSMGGMQVLEWAAIYPEYLRSIIPIAIGARHSAWAIGLNEVARQAITSDPNWQNGNYALAHQPESGLGLARAIAMLSYRSFDSLESKFGRQRVSETKSLLDKSFEIESYLQYQGVKLVKRFDANTYIYITKAMDDYDLSYSRGFLKDVLQKMTMPALVMGIDSDVLYPEKEQLELMEHLPNASYSQIKSPHGHDAFLIEFPQIAVQLRRFLGGVI